MGAKNVHTPIGQPCVVWRNWLQGLSQKVEKCWKNGGGGDSGDGGDSGGENGPKTVNPPVTRGDLMNCVSIATTLTITAIGRIIMAINHIILAIDHISMAITHTIMAIACIIMAIDHIIMTIRQIIMAITHVLKAIIGRIMAINRIIITMSLIIKAINHIIDSAWFSWNIYPWLFLDTGIIVVTCYMQYYGIANMGVWLGSFSRTVVFRRVWYMYIYVMIRPRIIYNNGHHKVTQDWQDCFLQKEAKLCVSNAFVIEDSKFKWCFFVVEHGQVTEEADMLIWI